MHYIIFVEDTMLAAPVEKADGSYFYKPVEHLKPITDDDYMNNR